MRVAVYPGTFNPIHYGHLAVVRGLLEAGFDCVYLVVSAQNPFKDPASALSARERYEAAAEELSHYPELNVRADDIELGMEPPSYTIRTLDALAAREPDNSFTLAMGADNMPGFLHWREWERILTDYGIAVYPRGDVDMAAVLQTFPEELRSRVMLLDAPRVDISSTEIRAAKSRYEIPALRPE